MIKERTRVNYESSNKSLSYLSILIDFNRGKHVYVKLFPNPMGNIANKLWPFNKNSMHLFCSVFILKLKKI